MAVTALGCALYALCALCALAERGNELREVDSALYRDGAYREAALLSQLEGDGGTALQDRRQHLLSFLFVWNLGAVTVVAVCLFIVWVQRRAQFVRVVNELPGPPLCEEVEGEGYDKVLSHLGAVRVAPCVPGTPHPDVFGVFERHVQRRSAAGHSMCRLWAFNPNVFPWASPIVLVWDPEIIAEILSARHYGTFVKGRSYRTSEPLIGSGLLSVGDGAHWKLQRRIANPAFAQAVLERAVHVTGQLLESRVFPRWDSAGDSDGAGNKALVAERSDMKSKGRAGAGPGRASSPWVRVELASDALRLSLDVLGQVAFSTDFGGTAASSATTGATLYESFERILTTLTDYGRTAPFAPLLPTWRNLRFRRALWRLNAVVEEMVTARKQAQAEARAQRPAQASLKNSDGVDKTGRAERSERPKDLLDVLLRQHGDVDEGGGSERQQCLSSKLVADNIKTFLFAGHDTTGSTLAWALWELAKHPCVQRRLVQELERACASTCGDRVVRDGDCDGGGGCTAEASSARSTGLLSLRNLRQLRLLDAVLKETLRLHPPAGFTREPLEDVVLGDTAERRAAGKPAYTVPAGADIFIFPYLVHRHHAHWGETASEFMPERWLQDDAPAAPFLPFSLGARNCVGMHLAQAELKAALAHIVRRYELAPLEQDAYGHGGVYPPATVLLMTLCPSKVWLRVRRRAGHAIKKEQ